ncbi:MAG: SLBB domain-containing protein [Acidobacteria bacterium]|nr:SLBB domain-containing protein [Acidobacteriota bacterium]MBV9071339.1 SLBB domain-containing protein [Acidobacteriota bacterium]MBV9476473.1 SLBB domain-containing protein [Acidobacteriota bacterium]
MKLRGWFLSLIVVLATFASAQELPILSNDSPVGPRDTLDIKVLEDPTMSGRTVINDDGSVALNVVGKVQVAGLTASQIEARLKTLLETSFITKATVSVQVVEFASKPISVVGAVVRPGRIGATGNTTLIQAITQAGGLTPGYGRELYVLRTGRNGLSEQVAIDIEDLMVNGNADLNIPLAPNDLVNVPLDTPVTVYVTGEVMRPGKAQFRRSQTPTLLQAIADAGGLTDRASRKIIIKRMVNGKETTLRADYKNIVRGRVRDVVLLDNDTVVVDEALF